MKKDIKIKNFRRLFQLLKKTGLEFRIDGPSVNERKYDGDLFSTKIKRITKKYVVLVKTQDIDPTVRIYYKDISGINLDLRCKETEIKYKFWYGNI